MKREAALSFFMEYLERYYFLICFAVYIHSERSALRSTSSGHCSFAEWMKERPELYSIIRRYNELQNVNLSVLSSSSFRFKRVGPSYLLIIISDTDFNLNAIFVLDYSRGSRDAWSKTLALPWRNCSKICCGTFSV